MSFVAWAVFGTATLYASRRASYSSPSALSASGYAP